MQYQSSVSWKCPSNIALVKYWGKYGRQMPSNPSISFTLSNAHTITEVSYNYSNTPKENRSLEFEFEGKPNDKFKAKIDSFLNSISDVFPLINHLDLKISSENSFPHSSGIASSASSNAALAMCLLDIQKEVQNEENIDLQKASFLSRLGSGSASRSIFPKIAVWGNSDVVLGSSNEFAIPYYQDIHEDFFSFHDDILIVSSQEKSVSSRAGHALMDNNPYSKTRFEQAHRHLQEIIDSMRKADYERFGHIVEKEALTLHALMMCSDPPYLLMEANSLNIINAIKEFRAENHIPVYFTLDAGPNIHLLYPDAVKDQVDVLKTYLRQFCHDEKILDDHVGNGPSKIK